MQSIQQEKFKSISSYHDKQIIYPQAILNERTCNCSKKARCPLQEKSLGGNIDSRRAEVISKCRHKKNSHQQLMTPRIN